MIFQVMLLVMPRDRERAIMGLLARNHFMIVSFIFSWLSFGTCTTFMDLLI